ncbi:putative transporter, partial [Podospora australis]
RPWKVVAGVVCLTIAVYGLLSSIGLFSSYWHQHMLQDYTPSQVSWIISIFGFLDCFMDLPLGELFDRHGTRWLLPIGCVVYAASFVGLAFSSTYGQLMGCMVVAGISAAIPTTVALTVVRQWFHKRMGLATGLVTTGAALGGIFFSLVLQELFQSYPWRTAIIILTCILAGFMVLGWLLIETNTSQRTAGSPPRSTFGELLGSLKFWLISYAMFGDELVLFIQWGSIPSYAIATRSGGDQFYLMMAYNIGAVVGRTAIPYLSDRIRALGPIRTLILMNIFTLLTVVAIWLPLGGTSITRLFAIVVLMGIGTGSTVPLGSVCVRELREDHSHGLWLGTVYTRCEFNTLIGNPSTEAILHDYGPNALVGFLGGVLLSGLISMICLPWRMSVEAKVR